MGTALYFPFPAAPPNSWFTQVLLYWDGAAFIDPYYSLEHRNHEFAPSPRVVWETASFRARSSLISLMG